MRAFLDAINGGPLRPAVRAAMEKALKELGNPSSLHREGRGAVQWRERARAQVAGLIGARAEEIFFTSSGTEANTWAIMGLARARESRGRHLVVSAVEHLSILHVVRRMEKEACLPDRQGWSVTKVPVDSQGRLDPEQVEQALTPETVLVSIQWANPEVGTLQPMEEIIHRLKGRARPGGLGAGRAGGILFHTDAVAAGGQVPIDMGKLPVDAMTLAAHTLGGPHGTGVLFLRKGIRIQPLFVGGAQEEGRRAGSENLLGIVGMGEAAHLASQELTQQGQRLAALRDRLMKGVFGRLPEAVLNGHPTQRLPGHVSLSFPGMDAEGLVLALDLQGVSVGLGSACSRQTMKVSHVLKAMGATDSHGLGTITCTMSPDTIEEEVDRFLEVLPQVAAQYEIASPSLRSGSQ